MSDKMMRIASRGQDGKSKSLQSDLEGNLKVSDKEFERSYKLTNGLREDFLYEGGEIVNFTSGYKYGQGTMRKENSYIEISLAGNKTDIAEIGVESALVDLSDFSHVYFEYELISATEYNSEIAFGVGIAPGQTSTNGSVRASTNPTNSKKGRSFFKLNVANVSEGYVKLHLKDESNVVSIDAKVRVYSVWAEKSKGISSSKSGVENSNFPVTDYHSEESVSLTAVKDNEGKASLRVIDSAPWGYDADTSSLRTVRPDISKVTSLTVVTESLATGNVFETDVISVGNIKELILSIDSKQTSTPLEVRVNYYLSDYTSKVKSVLLIDEAGGTDYRGTAITFKPDGAFVSLSIKNKATSNRTFTFETYGGR